MIDGVFMNEVVKFLEENSVQYFATIGIDGRPKVRPFQFMLKQDGKFYFCTSNQKEVFNELIKCPYVEISVSSKDFSWIRLSGKVKFTSDVNIKKSLIESNDLVKSIYQSEENPAFEAFYLEDGKVIIADFSGNAPDEYKI